MGKELLSLDKRGKMGDVFDALEEDGYFDEHVVSYERLREDARVLWKGKRYRVAYLAPNAEGYWLRSSPEASLIWADREKLENGNRRALTKVEYTIPHAPTSNFPTEAVSSMRNFKVRRA